jgi:putative tricarboxylic transport membrane protein
MYLHWRRIAALIPALVAVAFLCSPADAAWEPTKPIEFVIPAGTGGGADQMARLIAGIVEKHKLSPRPIIVVNKSGGAGAEGFLHVKGKKGDGHTMIITLSNLFTTPLAWPSMSSSCGSTRRRRTRRPRSTWPRSRSGRAGTG